VLTKGDRISGLFFLALSLYILQQSVIIGLGTLRQPGPGLLSFGAGTVMGLLACWLLFRSAVSKEQQPNGSRHASESRKVRLLLISLSLFAYAVAVRRLGFVCSTFLFVFFILGMIEAERWWRIAIKAALVTLGNYLVFEVWLGMRLPQGLLSW
jgi:putative tricarboxylic transport membrane protein